MPKHDEVLRDLAELNQYLRRILDAWREEHDPDHKLSDDEVREAIQRETRSGRQVH